MYHDPMCIASFGGLGPRQGSSSTQLVFFVRTFGSGNSLVIDDKYDSMCLSFIMRKPHRTVVANGKLYVLLVVTHLCCLGGFIFEIDSSYCTVEKYSTFWRTASIAKKKSLALYILYCTILRFPQF